MNEGQFGVSNSVMIGLNAGINLINESNVVIIGDNIKDLNKEQVDVLFINDKIAIGKTLNGERCNLYNILKDKIGK
jgi:hypothetical protein